MIFFVLFEWLVGGELFVGKVVCLVFDIVCGVVWYVNGYFVSCWWEVIEGSKGMGDEVVVLVDVGGFFLGLFGVCSMDFLDLLW